MDSIEHFDLQKNLNRVAAGFKGSDYFQNPVVVPARTVSDGYPPEYAEKIMATSIPNIPISDPWVMRRSK